MFKVSTKKLDEDRGIVYVLAIKLEEKVLIKIGVTARSKVEDRVAEILVSIWKSYRIFPELYVKRFKTTSNIFEKEAKLHRYFAEHKYTTQHVFSGCTEIFHLELDAVVEVYDKLLRGEDIESKPE